MYAFSAFTPTLCRRAERAAVRVLKLTPLERAWLPGVPHHRRPDTVAVAAIGLICGYGHEAEAERILGVYPGVADRALHGDRQGFQRAAEAVARRVRNSEKARRS